MSRSSSELQSVVAARAAEMGQTIGPEDVTIAWMEDDPAPGVAAFLARYRWNDNRAAITGIVVEGEEPNTRPRDAVAEVFNRWRVGGGFPGADRAADLAAFLLGGAGPVAVVHGDEDVDALVSQDEWKRFVQPPELFEADGEAGVRFWWLMRTDLSEMEVFTMPSGSLDVRNRFIRDFLADSGR